jgi:AraC-like DNA-binding protein
LSQKTISREAGFSHFSVPQADANSYCCDSSGNMRRDLSIDVLARRAAMSPRNFARLFTQEISKTPGMRVEDLRLEAARRQLESTAQVLKKL